MFRALAWILLVGGLSLACETQDRLEAASHARPRSRAREDEHAPAPAAAPAEHPAVTLGPRADLPGSGVSLEPPSRCHLAGVGARFVDATGKVSVSVDVQVTTPESGRLEDDSLWRQLWPGEGEAVRLGTIQARLWSRRREPGERGYDGWWLMAREGGRSLSVIAASELPEPTTPELWEELRKSALSLRWDPAAALEPERASGLRARTTPSLHLNRNVVANLIYAAEPAEHAEITLIPVGVAADADSVVQHCAQKLAETQLARGWSESPRSLQGSGVRGCSVSGLRTLDGVERWRLAALLVTSSGATLVANAQADTAAGTVWSPRFEELLKSVESSR